MKVIASEFVTSAAQLSQAPEALLPEVAFVGRSNVGKSSMINALLNRRKLARVSNTPGRTRLLNFFVVELEPEVGPEKGQRVKVSVCDLPGYGYAKAPKAEVAKWKAMIEHYLKERSSLRAVVSLIDSRHEPADLDLTLGAWLNDLGRPRITVATKIDKLSKSQRQPALAKLGRALGGQVPLGFSAETGEGTDALWDAVLAACR